MRSCEGIARDRADFVVNKVISSIYLAIYIMLVHVLFYMYLATFVILVLTLALCNMTLHISIVNRKISWPVIIFYYFFLANFKEMCYYFNYCYIIYH